jgi:hypothetical protein
MRYKKECNCGDCANSMYLNYFGKLLLPANEGNLEKSEEIDLNTVYFSFKTKFTQRNSEGFIDASIQIHPEDLPEYIEKLKEIYLEYQKVKKELKKQGKLENISESEEKNYIKNLKSRILPGQASPL